MIKAAFCDDDLSVLNELHVLMDNYRVERNQEITYTAFHSPLELIAQIEKGMRFDILFLDVLMPGVNGIETAQEIREYDSAMKIIFLTSSAEYAVESYTVNAYFYQLKPIWPESFYRLMDSLSGQLAKYNNFLRAHRSYLVNMEYIKTISSKAILMVNQDEIPVPHGKCSEIKNQYLEYAFSKDQVVLA